MRRKVVAIIPAAGKGKRFGGQKSFYPLLNEPLIIWPLRVLEKIDIVEEIIPVLQEADMERGAELFEIYDLTKIKKIAPGGKERQDSVYNALRLVKDKSSLILIHDGARPVLKEDLVTNMIKSIGDYDGIIIGVPVKDTIKEIDSSGDDMVVVNTPDRSKLWAIQTPQVFRYEVIIKAYEKAMAEKFYSTDDSALVERLGGRVKLIMGSYDNIKVTTKEDISFIEWLKSGEPKFDLS